MFFQSTLPDRKLSLFSALILLFLLSGIPVRAEGVLHSKNTTDRSDLRANFEDTCYDNNPSYQTDIVEPDCNFFGTDSAPANDLIENATQLAINEWYDCGSNAVSGATFGANNESGAFACDSANDSLPDVFYTFNSGDYIFVDIGLTLDTQSDFIMSVSEAGEDGDVIYCDSEINPFLLEKQTDYIIRIAPLSGQAGAGTFLICLSAMHICEDGSDPGDPCYTYFNAPGFVNNECECDPVVSTCSNPFNGGTVALSNSSNTIYYGDFIPNQYVQMTNAVEGNEYTLTSYQDETPGFLTVHMGASVISGYSPLTFTAPESGVLTVDINLDEYCSMTNAIWYSLNAQCNSCPYTCPELGGDYGDACSDGNPYTFNDSIAGDCTCVGQFDAAGLTVTSLWTNNCTPRNLVVKLYAAGNTDLLYSFTASADGSESFTLSDTIAAGIYDIYVKLDGYLSKAFYDQTLSAGTNTLSTGNFLPGDLNGDDTVNLVDMSLFNTSFGSIEGDSNFNYLADLNCDGQITLVDFSMQFIGFGQSGVQP